MTSGAGGTVVLNPSSGKGQIQADDVREALPGATVIEAEGDEIDEALRDAVDRGVPWLGVGGGDGTQRAAAALLAETGIVHVPVPAGTLNHFAKEVGLATLDDVVKAIEGGRTRKIDLGDVNGEVFVNNASIGFYAALVRERIRQEERMPKRVADVRAAWAQARHGHRFRVEVDGTPHRAWLAFAGNGCYATNLADLGARESLDAGVLDLRIINADRRLARVRVAAALFLGRLDRSDVVDQHVVGEVELRLPTLTVDVALDGEVKRLEAPLRLRSRVGVLTVPDVRSPEDASS